MARGFDIPREQLEAGWEAEEDRLNRADRCEKFVAFVHELRAKAGVPKVSDATAAEAFDIVEKFLGMWTAADRQGARLDWSLQMKAVPRAAQETSVTRCTCNDFHGADEFCLAHRMPTGHGHVRPRSDGIKARCGGPAMCKECAVEQAALNR